MRNIVWKLGALLMCAAMVFGCAVNPAQESAPSTETEPPITTAPVETAIPTQPQPTQTEPPTTEAVYIPQIYPNVVGLYIPADDGTKARTMIREFSSKRVAKKDIDCFEVFASVDETVTGTSFSAMWKNAWDAHEDTQDAKIGFHIQFALNSGETVSQVILKPGDAKGFYEYLEIYLYDDINQTPGVRYSHLEDDQMDADTIISSIKLTSGSRIEEVGDILLTAFIYNGDDCFDADGNYIGLVCASVVIKDKE